MNKLVFFVTVLSVLIFCTSLARTQTGHDRWYRGNTHTHTTNSDGDSSPEVVVDWYRKKGYDFLFLTDHHMVTDVSLLNKPDDKILVIAGQEVGDERYVHVNALNPTDVVQKQSGSTAGVILQRTVDAVKTGGGIAQVNHPNFIWALKADDIAATNGATLLEVLNLHPNTNYLGAGAQFPSAEEVWDRVLSKGKAIWGVASDDTHQIQDIQTINAGKDSRPGRAWIMVRAKDLSVPSIMSAIEKRDFYASTGVTLAEYSQDQRAITIKVQANTRFRHKYRIQFVGKH
jgi:predicted metal-dependent phosphoesterase TrpH